MKKRKRIFLETLAITLTLILFCILMVHYMHSTVLAMSFSEKICLEQEIGNEESRDCSSQDSGFTSIAPKFGSIGNTIRVNSETVRSPNESHIYDCSNAFSTPANSISSLRLSI